MTIKTRVKQPEVDKDFLSILNGIKIILFVLTMVFIFYPPYFRGLYFEQEQLPTQVFLMIIFICFWFYKYLKQDKRFLVTPIDYALMFIMLVYFIPPLLGAFGVKTTVYERAALLEAYKYFMYFSVFLILTELADTYKLKVAALWVIVSSTLGMCLLGFDGATGKNAENVLNGIFKWLGLNVSIFDTYTMGRIFSTLQYPNSFAAYAGAVFFIACGVLAVSKKLYVRAIGSAVTFIIFSAFIYTQSRGAQFLLPISVLIYIFALPKGKRIGGIIHMAIPVAIAVAFAGAGLLSYMASPVGKESTIWYLVLSGTVLSALLTLVASKFNKVFIREPSRKLHANKTVLLVAAGVIVIGGAVASMVLLTKIPLELPSNETKSQSVILKPDTQNELVINVHSTSNEGAPYTIKIDNSTTKGIISNSSETIALYDGKANPSGQEVKVNFNVPKESRVVNINFSNASENSKIVFDNARVVDLATGKTVKNIALKYKYVDVLAQRFVAPTAAKSLVERTIFYGDALKIIKDYWLTGAGGGAWPSLYFGYQSYLYWTTQVHSYIFQIAIECGVLGVMALLFMLFSIKVSFLSEYKFKFGKNEEDRTLQASLIAAISMLILHSIIDFDLSLASVSLLLWEIIALFNVRYRSDEQPEPIDGKPGFIGTALGKIIKLGKLKQINLHPIIGVLIVLPILISTASFQQASSCFAEAANQINQSKSQNTPVDTYVIESLLKEAMDKDDLMPQYRLAYLDVLINRFNEARQSNNIDEQTRTDYDNILNNFKVLEPQVQHDVNYSAKLGMQYIGFGKLDEGLASYNRAVALRPLRAEEWQQKIDVYYSVVQYFAEQGDTANAKKYIDQALASIDEARKYNANNLTPFIFNNPTLQLLGRIDFVSKNLSNLKGINPETVAFQYMPSMDVDLNGVPDQLSSEKGNVTSRPMQFEAGRAYEINLEAADSVTASRIKFKVVDVGEGVLVKTGNKYTAEFEIPSDFDVSKDKAISVALDGVQLIKSASVFMK